VDKKEFGDRVASLRVKKDVSARDMSLSLGLSAGYINNLENHANYPSMEVFFYICEYLGITPAEFFDDDNRNPQKLKSLIEDLKKLNDTQLETITTLIRELIK